MLWPGAERLSAGLGPGGAAHGGTGLHSPVRVQQPWGDTLVGRIKPYDVSIQFRPRDTDAGLGEPAVRDSRCQSPWALGQVRSRPQPSAVSVRP